MRYGAIGVALVAFALCGGEAEAAHQAAAPEIVFAANRAPELTGHIVRVGLGGGKTDLARGASVSAVAFSPNGLWVAFAEANGFYAVRLDGTDFQRLTPHVAGAANEGAEVVWSPDSRRVLIATNDGALYVGGPGIRARLLLASRCKGFEWSPSGQLVAYENYTLNPYAVHVSVVDVNGRIVRRVAGDAMPWRPSQSPYTLGSDVAAVRVLSPNGSFVANLSGPTDTGSTLRVSKRDGADSRTVAHFPRCTEDGGLVTGVGALLFTRDGSNLVYTTDCGELPSDLYEIGADGSGLRKLTQTTADEQQPAWSPNGSQVAYSRADAVGLSCQGCPLSIWSMNGDGTGQRNLTHANRHGCVFDGSPSWSPDGKEIVFSRATCNSSGHLFVVSAAGGSVRNLHVNGRLPAWGPSRIAYVGVDDARAVVDAGVYTAAPDGRDRQLVTKRTGFVPSWASNGQLRLTSLDDRTRTLTVIQGGKTRVVHIGLHGVTGAELSPDGTRLLLFVSRGYGLGSDLYTSSARGTDVKRLLTGFGVMAASWR
jgi:Tol biopolymer transport system component